MSTHPVVIIGPTADAHAAGIADRLRAMGTPVVALDATLFPGSLRITLGEQLDAISIDGAALRPASVYVRNLGLSIITAEPDPSVTADDLRRNALINRERADMIMGLVHRWNEAGVPFYNSPGQHRVTKPFQLGLLQAAGLPVPATCWTNDPAEVRRFAHGRRIAYKPVSGGAATRELTAADLTDERLDTLAASPVTFQELLPGEDIRVYVLDGEIVTAIRIDTKALDFRQNEDGCEAITLPAEVQAQCVRAAEVIGLRFTGLDIKRDAHGTLRFLELNPSPMFLGFDARAGTDIAGRFAARLASHVRPS